MKVFKPSEVLPKDTTDWIVAVDTETSGLFVDDGATVSIVSVAWIREDEPGCPHEGSPCSICGGGEAVGYAFPFDQGPRDKVDQVELDLEGGDPNLGFVEWSYLLYWLNQQWLVFQNAKFDLHHLRNGTRHWPGIDLVHRLYWDTMLASRELDPLENTSLKPTSERLGLTDGGERDEETAMKTALQSVAKRYRMGKRYDLVAWSIAGPYADKDTILTIQLCQHQQGRLAAGEGKLEWIDREIQLTKGLYAIERRGMRYDAEESLQAAGVLRARQHELAETMPFEPGINSAKRYFFGPEDQGGLGLPPYEVTEKKREPKLDDEIVRKMVRDEVPHAEQYQEWRKLDYAQSMWYRGYAEMVGDDGRLRCSFRQGKVVSGRMSVERVQLQAIPHQPISDQVPSVRELFIPAEGHDIYEIDLAQAELRVAAKLAKCETMLDMIAAGEDLHGVTATNLFDVRPGDEQWFFYRQIAKRGNFSFIFDVGPQTFRESMAKEADLELSLQESREIVYAWKALYPEFGRAVRRVADMVDARARSNGGAGYVKLDNGKRRWFAPYEESHKAFNQRVQAGLAEFNKDWLIETERITCGYDALIMSTHDSVDLELPEDGAWLADEVAEVGGKLATEMFGVPMEAEVSKW